MEEEYTYNFEFKLRKGLHDALFEVLICRFDKGILSRAYQTINSLLYYPLQILPIHEGFNLGWAVEEEGMRNG